MELRFSKHIKSRFVLHEVPMNNYLLNLVRNHQLEIPHHNYEFLREDHYTQWKLCEYLGLKLPQLVLLCSANAWQD